MVALWNIGSSLSEKEQMVISSQSYLLLMTSYLSYLSYVYFCSFKCSTVPTSDSVMEYNNLELIGLGVIQIVSSCTIALATISLGQ